MDLPQIADDWVAHWRTNNNINEDIAGDNEPADDLVRADPDAGLAVILLILERIDPVPTADLFQVLAAGPLEELLVHHGPAIIDRVEQQARDDPRFNLLLGGVWPNAITPEIWLRVQRIRSEVW
jgi:hypothetical protein